MVLSATKLRSPAHLRSMRPTVSEVARSALPPLPVMHLNASGSAAYFCLPAARVVEVGLEVEI